MPRNVRNFWIHASADGRAAAVATGPAAADGGCYLTLKMRHEGDIILPLIVQGEAREGGELVLKVELVNSASNWWVVDSDDPGTRAIFYTRR